MGSNHFLTQYKYDHISIFSCFVLLSGMTLNSCSCGGDGLLERAFISLYSDKIKKRLVVCYYVDISFSHPEHLHSW